MNYGKIAIRCGYVLFGGLLGRTELFGEVFRGVAYLNWYLPMLVLIVTGCTDVSLELYQKWKRREERRSKVRAEELRVFFDKRTAGLAEKPYKI